MAYVHKTITCSVPLFQEFPHKVELCFYDSGHGKSIVLGSVLEQSVVSRLQGQCRSPAENI